MISVMYPDIKGRTMIVAGCGSGIGEAIVSALSEENRLSADVVGG